MIYYSELYHHGIKGQKWGVRNGPPYPLDGSHKQKRTGSNGKKSKLSEDQIKKIIAISAGVAIAGGITYLALSRGINSTFDPLSAINYEELLSNSNFKSLKEIPKLKSKESTIGHMDHINQGYPGPGCTNNCTFCTAAMALREKGYDVDANLTASTMNYSTLSKFLLEEIIKD